MSPARRLSALIALASGAALGGAFAFQHWGGLAPCVLCVYQRYPHGGAIVLALAAVVLMPRHVRAGRALLAVCAALLLTGAAIAAYHVAIEQGWIQGSAACSAQTGSATTLEEMRAQVANAPIVRCDEVAWSLAGVSLAQFNLIVSAALACAALWAAARVPAGARP